MDITYKVLKDHTVKTYDKCIGVQGDHLTDILHISLCDCKHTFVSAVIDFVLPNGTPKRTDPIEIDKSQTFVYKLPYYLLLESGIIKVSVSASTSDGERFVTKPQEFVVCENKEGKDWFVDIIEEQEKEIEQLKIEKGFYPIVDVVELPTHDINTKTCYRVQGKPITVSVTLDEEVYDDGTGHRLATVKIPRAGIYKLAVESYTGENSDLLSATLGTEGLDNFIDITTSGKLPVGTCHLRVIGEANATAVINVVPLTADLYHNTNGVWVKVVNEYDLETELAKATETENKNTQAISEEIERAKKAEQANAQTISEETERAKKAEQNLADSKQDNLTFDGEYNKVVNPVATVETVMRKVAEIVAGADGDFDTLKELADWLTTHGGEAAEMNSDIKANTENIAKNMQDIADEIIRAKLAETANADAIKAEETRAKESEDKLDTRVSENNALSRNAVEIATATLNTAERAKVISEQTRDNLSSHISVYNEKVKELDIADQTQAAALADFAERVNALLASDDTTLDQLQEVVNYIKNNKNLIDGITTSKVNISDIIDNLLSEATDKPLSANQGRILKALIDAEVSRAKEAEAKAVQQKPFSKNINNQDANNKVIYDQDGDFGVAYVRDYLGNEKTVLLSKWVKPFSVPMRNDSGNLLTYEPNSDNECTNKKYVDNANKAINENIQKTKTSLETSIDNVKTDLDENYLKSNGQDTNGTLGISYTLYDTYANVQGVENSISPIIEIASIVQGVPVTGINSFSGGGNHIKKIICPNTLTSFGNTGVFYGLRGLEFCNVPSQIQEIPQNAFGGCYALTSVFIGKGVKEIKNSAFNACNNLRYVYYEGSQSEWNSININSGNQRLLEATIYFNQTFGG